MGVSLETRNAQYFNIENTGQNTDQSEQARFTGVMCGQWRKKGRWSPEKASTLLSEGYH